jgi:hypothetical protein
MTEEWDAIEKKIDNLDATHEGYTSNDEEIHDLREAFKTASAYIAELRWRVRTNTPERVPLPVESCIAGTCRHQECARRRVAIKRAQRAGER